jgi:serine/threonine protein kinase
MSSELRPGAHCGDYELLAHIGQGGMAQVWSARSLASGELVAIKTLLPAYRENAVLKERLSREGQSQNFLHHPNILRSLGTFQWMGLIFMVMDLVDGESLEKYIRRRRIMPVPEVRGVAQAVLSALSHAHANSIVHRDVKPSNILLSRQGKILLGDFGIALLQNSTRLTRFGGMGTPCYMSPEQIVGRKIDHRSDIYSVSCVLYELLTGAPPFHATGSNANEVIRSAHRHTAPDPLIPKNPEVPAALEKAVLRALEKTRGDRFESCAEFAAALGVSIQIRTVDDERVTETDINPPSHSLIVLPPGRADAAVAGAGARSTPSIEMPHAGTPSGTPPSHTPKDAAMSDRSRGQKPISGPGVTSMRHTPTSMRHSPTSVTRTLAAGRSFGFIRRRPGLVGVIAIVTAILLLAILAISRARSVGRGPAPPATVTALTVSGPPVGEVSGATGQSAATPSPAVPGDSTAPQDEPPTLDSTSRDNALDQMRQTVADRSQPAPAAAQPANTAGDTESNRPPPLSPPPVSGSTASGLLQWAGNRGDEVEIDGLRATKGVLSGDALPGVAVTVVIEGENGSVLTQPSEADGYKHFTFRSSASRVRIRWKALETGQSR